MTAGCLIRSKTKIENDLEKDGLEDLITLCVLQQKMHLGNRRSWWGSYNTQDYREIDGVVRLLEIDNMSITTILEDVCGPSWMKFSSVPKS